MYLLHFHKRHDFSSVTWFLYQYNEQFSLNFNCLGEMDDSVFLQKMRHTFFHTYIYLYWYFVTSIPSEEMEDIIFVGTTWLFLLLLFLVFGGT